MSLERCDWCREEGMDIESCEVCGADICMGCRFYASGLEDTECPYEVARIRIARHGSEK